MENTTLPPDAHLLLLKPASPMVSTPTSVLARVNVTPDAWSLSTEKLIPCLLLGLYACKTPIRSSGLVQVRATENSACADVTSAMLATLASSILWVNVAIGR